MPRPERVAAHIRHETVGRLRLHVPALQSGEIEARALSLSIGEGGVRAHVEVRPVTGSVVIHYEGERAALMKALGKRFKIAATPPEPPREPPLAWAQARTGAADQALRKASKAQLGVADLTFVLMLVVAVIQAARGRLAGPALSYVFDALSLAMARSQRGV